MRPAVAARLVPLVVLGAVLLVAVLLRVGSARRIRALSPAIPVVPEARPDGEPRLTGGAFAPDAAVAAGAPRMLHGDARHTHRARGRGPRAATVAWAARMPGAVEAQITSSPDESVLYVASLDGSLTALATRDGTVLWRTALGERAYATPAVGADGVIFAGSDARRVVAVEPTGRIAWKLELRGDADTGPVIDPAGRLVLAAGRTVLAVRPRGDVAWRFDAKGKVYTSPALAPDGRVLFGAQDHRAYVLTGEGKLLHAIDLGADVDGAPVVGEDGAAFFGTDGGEVVRIDSGGAIAWRTQLGGFVRGTLALARSGDVLAGVYGPTPRAVRVASTDGRLLGSFPVQGTGSKDFGVHGGALEDDDGTLYFGGQDDAAYAVARDGTVLFRFATDGDVDAPLTLLSNGALVVASDEGSVYLLRSP